ncbi:MAG: T9SS type A sorting domain-containing protein, partial [Bacteroidales bacterium]|nr:T9SS type A sorting domain-containing protein [Bacteroidales bacterium]
RGVCPCGWHVPSDAEWKELENYLGGAFFAGGKMKETGTAHWKSPNTGATNSSGFTGLPAGEFDAYYSPNKFWLLKEYAIFWTSTQSGQSKAIERYLSYDNAASGKLPWYKVMKYSIRCVKDTGATGLSYQDEIIPLRIQLKQNYPNPFNPTTKIEYNLPMTTNVILKIYNVLGQEVKTLINEMQTPGTKSVIWDATNNFGEPVSSGIYIYRIQTNEQFKNIQHRKMIFIK